jgi:hypothetical protein
MDLDTFLSLPPCQPIKYEFRGNIAVHVYSISQIDLYGCPDTWHPPLLCDWMVISTNDDERPLATDYKYEQSILGNTRPIHRYSRVKRFEYVLFQLLGHRGSVDLNDLVYIRSEGVDPHPERVWNSIREILKRGNLQKYYNRIPAIIQMLGLSLRIDVGIGSNMVYSIVADFKRMHEMFKETKPTDRKYFPNLRFIALRMLQEYGAKFGFHIPLVRTKRKLKPLDDMWNALADSFFKIKNAN